MVRISLGNRSLNRERDYDFDDFKPRRRRRFRRRGRRLKWKAGCCLFFLLAFLIFGIVVTAAIAKTGLVTIPIFSAIFYQPPVVERTVSVDKIDSGMLSQKLKQAPGLKTLTLTEAELTLLFKQALTSSKDSYFAPGVQVIITDTGLEFLGLLQKPVAANIAMKLKPSVEAGKLKLSLVSASVGSLSMPPALADWLLSEVFGKNIQTAIDQLASTGLSDVKLTPGALTLTF